MLGSFCSSQQAVKLTNGYVAVNAYTQPLPFRYNLDISQLTSTITTHASTFHMCLIVLLINIEGKSMLLFFVNRVASFLSKV